MSNDIKNWAKRQTVGERNAKVILLEIADVADDDGYSWYSIPTIAATLEASTKTVERGIAYLVDKKIITRADRERKSGRYTSKGTQINISEDDWQKIQDIRAERKAKSKLSPTDNLTDGNDSPTDNLTGGESKQQPNHSLPTDKMTYGETSPTDNLTVGQNDGQYTKNKDVFSEPLKTHTPRARVSGHSPSNENGHLPKNKTIIPVSEVFSENTSIEKADFDKDFFDGLDQRNLCTPFDFPDWQVTAEILFKKSGASAELALEGIDWIKTSSKDWRKGRITAKVVASNFGIFLDNYKLQAKEVDYSKCPDCHGSGVISVNNRDAAACEHKALMS
jgi:Helix-turn-helix domain